MKIFKSELFWQILICILSVGIGLTFLVLELMALIKYIKS